MNRIYKVFHHLGSFRRSVSITLVTFLLIVFGASIRGTGVVYANEVSRVISHSATFLAQGETANDIVVIGNDVHVAGTVTDNLIVINGTAYLTQLVDALQYNTAKVRNTDLTAPAADVVPTSGFVCVVGTSAGLTVTEV